MPHTCIGSSFWISQIYQQTLIKSQEIKVKCYFHTVKGDFNGYVFPSQMLLGMFGKVPNDSIFQGDENR